MPQSPTKSPQSPTKSPKKGSKTRARDVLQLPKPYCYMKSDTIKRWNAHYEQGKSLEEDEKDYQLFKTVEFTHALILKVNQLSKQVRMKKMFDDPKSNLSLFPRWSHNFSLRELPQIQPFFKKCLT